MVGGWQKWGRQAGCGPTGRGAELQAKSINLEPNLGLDTAQLGVPGQLTDPFWAVLSLSGDMTTAYLLPGQVENERSWGHSRAR